MSKAKLRAEAINRFVTDAKAQGVYSSLKAACIMTGWDTLAGALTPLVGSAPTNSGFLAADYDRGGQGLKGDASSKYLDSNRANNADGQNDKHLSVYVSKKPEATGKALIGAFNNTGASGSQLSFSGSVLYAAINANTSASTLQPPYSGFVGATRSSSATIDWRSSEQDGQLSLASVVPESQTVRVFARNFSSALHTDARMSWYSIGSSVDLSSLDTLVTRLMADLRAIEEDGMDRDAQAYCRAVEAADGSFMVTGVKQAVDRLVKGLKFDKDANGRSAWDAIGASCLLCGPRTIAGALVPLKGVAPTAQGGWTSSDYNQETGLKGNGSTLYLDTNRAGNADGQDDAHIACFLTTYDTASPTTDRAYIGVGGNGVGAKNLLRNRDAQGTIGSRVNAATLHESGYNNDTGFVGASRSSASTHSVKSASEYDTNSGRASDGVDPLTVHVFGLNWATNTLRSNARLAFYSLGASLSLSALDSRITKYVSDVAAAIP